MKAINLATFTKFGTGMRDTTAICAEIQVSPPDETELVPLYDMEIMFIFDEPTTQSTPAAPSRNVFRWHEVQDTTPPSLYPAKGSLSSVQYNTKMDVVGCIIY